MKKKTELTSITVKLSGKTMSGKTEVKYNPDGSKTVTENIPITPDDPVFSAISPDFIPQMSILDALCRRAIESMPFRVKQYRKDVEGIIGMFVNEVMLHTEDYTTEEVYECVKKLLK